MSTDTTNDRPEAPAEQAIEPSGEQSRPDETLSEPEAPAQTEPSEARAVERSVAETAWDDDESEPGDDIGNRIDGPPQHERTSTGEASSGASGKRRRRRRKKGGASEPDEDSGADGNAREGAGASGQTPARRPQQDKGQPSAQQRERPAFRVGEEVFGRVLEVTDDAVFVDLSGKARAIFDRLELHDEQGPVPGDHFVALVHGDGSRGGLVVLTRDPDRVEETKKRLEASVTAGELVPGLVTGVIKGGVEVDVEGLRAFAPGSHVDLRLGADLRPLVGRKLPFSVMKYTKNGSELVLSRRALLEQEAAEARKQALAKLEAGQVVHAVVRTVVEWGVFVAIPSANNVEGLVHVTEASHERGTRLADQFRPGQELEVKVLRIDDKGKLWLSRKAVAGDPWESAAERFAVGSRHVGRIARLQPFGAFVELASGIDGLLRVGDLSLRRVNDPSEVVAVGQEIEVVVAHLDIGQRRIGLHPAPPEGEQEAPQKVAPHRVVRVAVVSAESAGLLVRVLGVTGASSRGFIPAGHTGTARGTDLRREFPAGTRLEAKVIEMDSRRGECKLSIRALKEDTEKAAFNEYRASVARESKFGTFGDLFAKRNGS